MTKAILFYRNSLLTKLFMLVILLVGGGNSAWGYEPLTINDGSAESENTPIVCGQVASGTLTNGYCQFVIPKSSISAMEGKSITHISFYNSIETLGWNGAEYTIYMQEVDYSSFSTKTYEDWNGTNMTEVYSGSLPSVSNYLMTIELSSKFDYVGDYLLIGFKKIKSASSRPTNYKWKGVSATNTALYTNWGSINYDGFLPKMTFTYEDKSDAPVVVSAPTDLTALGTTPISTELTWTNGGDETTWQLSYSTTSSDHSTTTSDFTTKPYTLSGLTYNTKYYVSIRAKKGSNYSDWSDEIYFTTANAVAVESVTVDPTEWEMVAGDTKTLTATVSPDNATIKDVTWESNNTSVATVSSNGIVTAVAPGDATITVTSTFDGTKAATCDITVLAPVTPTAFKAKDLLPNYAYLTWVNGSSETKWQIKYGTTSGSLNNQSSDLTEKPHLLTNLSANTTYYASIRSKLGTKYSDWSDEISFTTPSIGASPGGGAEVTEDFDSDWPTTYGSYLSNTKDGWGYVNGYSRYGASTTHRRGDSGNGLYGISQSSPYYYIVTPYIKAGSTISFFYKFTTSSTGYIRFYKATKAGSSYYVHTGTQYGSILSNKETDMVELDSPITITDGGYVAIFLSNAAIDDFTYTYQPNVSVVTDNNGFTTFANINKLDMTMTNLPSGLEAYKAKVEGSIVKFTKLDQNVPENTGVLLKGDANTEYRIAIASTSNAVEYNEFSVNIGGTTFDADEGYTYYGLIKNSNPLTFGVFAPSSVAIPSNKAYLKVENDPSGEARQLVCSFSDETPTGISATQNDREKTINDEFIYNLNGQRVNKPSKGLYIVNGKKVIIK